MEETDFSFKLIFLMQGYESWLQLVNEKEGNFTIFFQTQEKTQT